MPSKMTKSRKRLITILSIALVILLGIGTFVAISIKNSNNENSGNSSISKTERTLSGKSIDEDRKDALKSTENLLTTALKYKGKLTPEERAEKIADGDLSVIDPKIDELIRFTDVFNEKELKANVYQALIAITKFTAIEGKVVPVSNNAYQSVFVDQDAGVAYVPMSSFSDNGAVFSLEMVYVDNTWKLSPYSFMEIIKISAMK